VTPGANGANAIAVTIPDAFIKLRMFVLPGVDVETFRSMKTKRPRTMDPRFKPGMFSR
jgi:hypothetical protein